MSDPRFRWPPRAIRFAQEALGRFSGRRQLAAKERIPPTTVLGFERRLGIASPMMRAMEAFDEDDVLVALSLPIVVVVVHRAPAPRGEAAEEGA